MRPDHSWLAAAMLCALSPLAALASECSPELAKTLSDPARLRELASDCERVDPRTHLAAILRLNSLPPPAAPRLMLHTPPQAPARIVRVVLQGAVYFRGFESYPTDAGLKRLADMVRRMGEGYRIERVEVIGFADPNEEKLPKFRVAQRRATFVRDYFVDAGVPPERVLVANRGPAREDTPEGRSRDRAALIRILILRQRAEQGA